jgi:hypothetical protein
LFGAIGDRLCAVGPLRLSRSASARRGQRISHGEVLTVTFVSLHS